MLQDTLNIPVPIWTTLKRACDKVWPKWLAVWVRWPAGWWHRFRTNMAARLDYIQLLVVIHRYRYSKWKTSHIHSYQQLVQLIFEKKKNHIFQNVNWNCARSLHFIWTFYFVVIMLTLNNYQSRLVKFCKIHSSKDDWVGLLLEKRLGDVCTLKARRSFLVYFIYEEHIYTIFVYYTKRNASTARKEKHVLIRICLYIFIAFKYCTWFQFSKSNRPISKLIRRTFCAPSYQLFE